MKSVFYFLSLVPKILARASASGSRPLGSPWYCISAGVERRGGLAVVVRSEGREGGRKEESASSILTGLVAKDDPTLKFVRNFLTVLI